MRKLKFFRTALLYWDYKEKYNLNFITAALFPFLFVILLGRSVSLKNWLMHSDRTGLPKMAYRKQAANLTVVINQEPKANWLVTTVNPAIAGK